MMHILQVQKAAEVLGFAGFRSAGLELLEKVAAEENEWSQLASTLLLYCEVPVQNGRQNPPNRLPWGFCYPNTVKPYWQQLVPPRLSAPLLLPRC